MKKKHISSHSNYCASTSQVRAYLNPSWFQPEFCTEIPWLHLMIWHLCVTPPVKFLLYVLQIRYHFITAKQDSCDPLDINLEKTTAWFGLYEQMQFLFKLCIELKQRDCNTCFGVIVHIWKNVLFQWSQFSFEILKGSHTTTGQQKGKLAFTKSSKVQNAKYCMKLIDEEL